MRTARARAVAAVVAVAVIGVAALGFRLASLATPNWLVAFVPLYVLLAVAGTVVIARPTNLSGWSLFLAVAVSIVENFGYAYGLYPKLNVSGPLPLAWPAVLIALSLQSLNWPFLLPMFLALPSGRLTRGRAVAAAVGMAVPVSAAALVLLTPDAPYGPNEVAVRTAARTYGPGAETAYRVAWSAFEGFVIASGAWVLFQVRRGDAVVRQQGKWLLAGAVPVLALVFQVAVFAEGPSPVLHWAWTAALIFFAVCVAVAITKYRLFDIDVLISKAVLYALMAAIIAVVYTVLVGALAYVVEASSPSFALSVVGATGAALVLFPLQERLRRYANVVVFGRQASPYEAMSSFSRALGDALRPDEVLPAIAEAVKRGTGAQWVQVSSSHPGAERTVELGEPAASPVETFDVRIGGATVGEISLRKRPGDVVTPTERRLLEDLAVQAGPAVHNVALAVELEARLGEITEQAEALRRSRERIVAAQDAERRRIERDLHDGLQQSLVSLAGQLRALARIVVNEPDRARTLVDQLAEEAKGTLEQVRDLAHGVFPQILRDAGIVAALRSQLAKIAGAVGFRVDPSVEGLRFAPTAEVAVYFCCLEALQNVTKHAGGSPAVLTITRRDDRLVFSVSDRGPGFDPGATEGGVGITSMSDRLAAVGGSLEVSSKPGGGTVVSGSVPLKPTRSDRLSEGGDGERRPVADDADDSRRLLHRS